jgi:hypothetical protein
MSFDSMLYTMGTALNRAMDSHTRVELLVQGQWISGFVLAVDGHGMVLDHSEEDHYFIRVEQIAVVRVMGAAPMGAPTPTPPSNDVPVPRLATT